MNHENHDEENDSKNDDEITKSIKGTILYQQNGEQTLFKDIAGLDEPISALREAAILPYYFPHLFTGIRSPARAILLFGPPGTGKTALAKALANESGSKFYAISSTDLISKWLGQSEKLVRELFSSAKKTSPSIIFIDEVDSLCGSRSEGENESARRIKTEILVQLQGITGSSKDVLVLAATNLPWELDSAIRRRFEKRIYIPLPNQDARRKIIHQGLNNVEHSVQENTIDWIVEETEGYSGSDLSDLIRSALMEPIRLLQRASHFVQNDSDGKWKMCEADAEGAQPMSLWDCHSSVSIPPVDGGAFQRCLAAMRPSVSQQETQQCLKFNEQFGNCA
eukprot:gb/GECH01010342.1/.p1 GENE.gb/GECH01010342.1/~~gb/GECH01010342.1/.p1  ORF type:complete len:337 (+),score=113.43 gb/GECH01010342.1/:1-1011(+)